MKKVLFTLTFLFTLLLSTSCSSNSAEGNLTKAMDAYCAGDFETFVSYLCEDNGAIIPDNMKSLLVAGFKEQQTTPAITPLITTYKIAESKTEGDIEVFTLDVTYTNGKTGTATFPMMKNADGKWCIMLSKVKL